MTYATQTDLEERFGATELTRLTDRTNKPATTIDVSVVSEALTDATSLIDGYIGKKYQLPLATVPGVLKRLCADIARYYLHGKHADKEGPVERAYRDAERWLKDVARGHVSLDDGTGEQPDQPGGGGVRVSSNSRPINEKDMKGYI